MKLAEVDNAISEFRESQKRCPREVRLHPDDVAALMPEAIKADVGSDLYVEMETAGTKWLRDDTVPRGQVRLT